MSVAIRYINREIAAVFIVTLLMLLLVAVGGRFIGYLQEAAMGKFTGSVVLTIMALRLPEFIQIVSPFAVYVAIILTFGRLYADQEMVVLQNAGASTARLLGWTSISLLVVVAAVAYLAFYATPNTQRALVDYMAEQRAQTDFETVNAGVFHVYDRGRRVTYSQSMSSDRKVLRDVFMAQRLNDGRQATVWAESGTQQIDPETGAHFLVLERGRRYEGTPGMPDFRIVEFAELHQKLAVNPRPERFEVEAQPMLSLGDDPQSRAEWHWRVGLPIFCLLGGLLGLGISRVKPRQGRFARVVPGMLIMLLYYLALLINRNALEEGQLPAVLGLWPVHLVFGGIAVYNLRKLALPVKA
ncbi:MAG: LPS export ABC transporter permease LptF [Pseudomonadales bacterium]